MSGAGHTVYVFDAAGQQNCDGTPKECSELWTAAVPLACDAPFIVCGISAPAVARGVLYVTGREGGFTGGLFAFDANGTSSCSESPKQCSPLWTSNTAATRYPPAIGNGAVYTVAFSPSGIYRLRAFDATGTQGCTGTPKICEPLWTSTTEGFTGAPTAANGVVYAVGLSPETCDPLCTATRHLYAFDGSGVQGCSGTPKQCAPLLDETGPEGVETFADPVVANGVLYVGDGLPLSPLFSDLGVVHAYTL